MWQVTWLQPALDELTTIWTQADSASRRAITAATHSIDQVLQADPQNQGESREEGERVLFAFPLGIAFEVDDQQSVVWVLHVWDIRRKH
jgi:hypothetical protein